MSPEHRLKTAATLSSVWDGQPIKRVRAGDGVTILVGRRLAMHMMVQPDFSKLVGPVLEAPIRVTDLKKILIEMRKAGVVAFDLPPGKKYHSSVARVSHSFSSSSPGRAPGAESIDPSGAY